MTSVLSLTAAASADYTFATSALLATEADGFKAIDLSALTDLAGHDVGALWRRDPTLTQSLVSATWTGLLWGSLGWDTGSWTDSNSQGLLRVPNDKWSHVEIGATITLDVIDDGAFRIVTILGTASTSINYPYQTYNYDGTTACAVCMQSIVQVASGDVFQAQAFISNGANAWDNVSNEFDAFWIRGYTARG